MEQKAEKTPKIAAKPVLSFVIVGADGEIRFCLSMSPDQGTMLALSTPPGSTAIAVPANHAAFLKQARFRAVNGALVEKTEVTIELDGGALVAKDALGNVAAGVEIELVPDGRIVTSGTPVSLARGTVYTARARSRDYWSRRQTIRP